MSGSEAQTRPLAAFLMRTLATRTLDFLIPPRCLVCDRPTEAGSGLCPSCWAAMPFVERPWCERLGLPFSHDIGEGAWSPQAIASPPLFDRARSVALYQGPARKLVLALKFAGRRDVAPAMGRWMGRVAQELADERSLIVPVPLHRRRLWQRRFNQAALLAVAMGRDMGLPVCLDALERVMPTRHQIGLSAKERHRNVRRAFRVKETAKLAVFGRSILLVDDVFTTGSTVTACTRVLLSAGASKVDVMTFAIADPVTGSE